MTETWNVSDLLKLREISRELNSETDSRRILERIIDTAVDMLGAERGFLILLEGGEQKTLVARNIDEENINNPNVKFSHTLVEYVVKTGQAVLLEDARKEDIFNDAASIVGLSITSILCIPFLVKGKPEGVLYVDHRKNAGVFQEYQQKLLEELCNDAAVAYDNARIKTDLARLNNRLANLNRKLGDRISTQRRELRRLEGKKETPDSEPDDYYGWMIGKSAAMKKVYGILDKVKAKDVTVLVTGESGTGKELTARALHGLGPRNSKPFLAVNCSALHEQILESELFGHVRGAFTGAIRDKAGIFEAADGGTVFLDEIGETPPGMQAKLLRVLQDGSYLRVGETTPRKANVRIIAATNRDLTTDESFRKDLYFRLKVIEIRMPPLRERREDIPVLVKFLVAKYAEGDEKLSDQAIMELAGRPWPGNVRELENDIQRLLLLGESALEPAPTGSSSKPLKDALRAYEQDLIQAAIARCGGNKTRAAEELGISREWLSRRLKELQSS